MVKLRLLPILCCCLLAGLVAAQTHRTCINDGWQYYEINTATPPDANSVAQLVTLPHTWNNGDDVDPVPGYRRGASWYVRSLQHNQEADERTFLYLEGANIKSQVWLNGQQLDEHIGGYVGFEVELTDHLRNGKNIIAIRVDNGIDRAVVPSQKADFFIYGGITRDVYLVTSPATRISDCNISTPEVTATYATTTAVVMLDGPIDRKLSLLTQVRRSGQVVAQSLTPVKQTETTIQLPGIENPDLWSPDAPNLYNCTVELLADGHVLDRYEHQIGYRYYKFDPHGAFYLNGQRLKLRGTHRHEEHAGYGAAVPDSIHRADMEQIKEMGANFIRLAHYPQDPAVYQACDELGLIVWDELPWCRGGIGDSTWQANTTRLLREQIQQNYNHPSILFWSLGNEMYWLPDYEGGDDRDKISTYLQSLHDLAKSLDPARYTAARKYYAGSEIVDVFSPSIWSGWYAGSYTNYGATLEDNRDKYKQFLHMEYGGSSHVGRHVEVPIADLQGLDGSNWAEVVHQSQIVSIAKSGDWTESYMVDLFDWYLHISENTDWFAGNAQWAFKDFGTPLRPENSIPYMNQKGLVDRAGKPKDSYYVFKSYWAEEPFVWIESPTWTHRFGEQGDTLQQCVYSNADRVELYLNGQSLGAKTRSRDLYPAQGLSWPVVFDQGVNTLQAQAYVDGKLVDDIKHRVSYQAASYGKADEIVITAEALDEARYMITATMQDRDGQRVYDYEDRVYFDISGSGHLEVNQGTPTGSQVIDFANGKAHVIVNTLGKPCVIEARNQNFKGSYLTIEP